MDVNSDILDYIDDSLVTIDPERKILLFNQQASRIQRTIADSPLVVGDDFLNYIRPDRRRIVKDIIDRIRKTREIYKTFAEYQTGSGGTVSLDLSYVPVFKGEGLSHIHVIGLDVTSQKVFERKLTDMVTAVTTLVEHANAIIFTTDSRKYITDWNHHCNEVFGYEKNEVFTRRTDLLIDPDDRPAFDSYFEKVLSGENVGKTELPFKTRSGRKLVVMLSATPRISKQQVVGVTFVGHDITELTAYRTSLEKKIEERSRELQEALKKEREALEIKSRFVAIASHEFRTPLSSIHHGAKFLRDNYKTVRDELIEEKLMSIARHSEHMTHLLDDVLTYGKSEPGKIRIFVTDVNVREFFARIIEEVGHSTMNTHVIEPLFHNAPEKISIDEKLFRNIIINLLTNAVKFSPGHRKVELVVQGLPERIQITVKDRGIGIPPGDLGRIFEPFLRGQEVSEIPGTGLGLAIAKKACDLLNGSISVESEPGRGSMFRITIPIVLNQS